MKRILFKIMASVCIILYSSNLYAQTGLKATISATHNLCFQASDGVAVLTVTGGIAPYSYSWSDGSSSKDLSNVSAGLYSVKVTDAAGNFTSACIEILQPSPISVSLKYSETVCKGGFGNATITVSGGTAPYTYSWSDGKTSAIRSDLTAGNYTVTVSDSKNCNVSKSFQINEGGNFQLAVTSKDIKCYGNYDGSAKVTVSGATGLTYSWSNGEIDDQIDNVPAGPYTVKVTDEKGCTHDSTFTINQPTDINLNAEISNDPCIGAKISGIVTGGLSPYSYFWSTGARTSAISGLSNGTYFLTISDKNGCRRSTTAEVTNMNILKVTLSAKDVSCNAEKNGAINVSPSGGLAPYTYKWGDGPVSEDRDNLSAGYYWVTVTDANNCSKTEDADVFKDDPFNYEMIKKNISCYGAGDGSVSFENSRDLSFVWSDGDTSRTRTYMTAGDYTVVITSPEGCTKEVEITISEPYKPEIYLWSQTEVCAGGKIDLTMNGGTEPFTFNWSGGQTTEDVSGLESGYYSVVVIDNNGCKDSAETYVDGGTLVKPFVTATNVTCNGKEDGTARVSISGNNAGYKIAWSNGATTSEIVNLRAGAYSVKVTDSKNCIYTASGTVAAPSSLETYIFKTEPTCTGSADGILRSITNGGTSPYKFLWNHGATSSNILGLPAGSFQLTVTDNNGCIATATAVLTDPTPVRVTYAASNSCKGSSAVLEISGGKSPYKTVWNDGFSGISRANLTARNYTVSVSDANFCSASVNVVIPDYTNVKVTAVADGNTARAVATGGILPYSWLWSTGQATAEASNLPAGTHTVKVTDAAGCSSETSVTINAVTTKPLTATINCCEDNSICKGETASIPVYFTGQAPFTFSYQAGVEVKSVTTSENPYMLQVIPTQTTTYSLLSVSNGCSNGTVCGKATEGVNNCGTRCEMTCFSAEVGSVTEHGDCRDVQLIIRSNGSCKYGLSHLSVSVPCGKVGAVSNSRNFMVEKGTDPTSKINGFKIDNVSNFGESRKAESFVVNYTICKSGSDCYGEFCPPLLAFKASTCVYYVKPEYRPENAVISSMESEMNTAAGEVIIYPNPGKENSDISIKLPAGEYGSGRLIVSDFKGQILIETNADFDSSDSKTTLNLHGLSQGMYVLRIEKGEKQFIRKIDIE